AMVALAALGALAGLAWLSPALHRPSDQQPTTVAGVSSGSATGGLGSAPGGPGSATGGPGSDRWTPVLDDGFEELSAGRWHVFDNESWDRDDARVLAGNVAAHGGELRLRARREHAAGRAFTSGDLRSQDAFSLPDYFKVTVTAKVPIQHGLWSAPLWLRPLDGGAGEIDLVETYGGERSDPRVHQTIHTGYGVDHRASARTTRFADLPGTATGWHTYTAAKTPGRIRMWVDGVLTADFSATTVSWYDQYYERGARWQLRISLQVGGYDVPPDAGTDWRWSTSTLRVDRIRAWAWR
ncbi:MAG: family 16 glycosylhydrolase, partial [Nocardioidaceae bacterium]